MKTFETLNMFSKGNRVVNPLDLAFMYYKGGFVTSLSFKLVCHLSTSIQLTKFP